jgi:putative hydrolase of HD superfamily
MGVNGVGGGVCFGAGGGEGRVGQKKPPPDPIYARIAFLLEADKLKTVLRRTPLVDASRLENSAEHSWHLALAAMVLAASAPAGVNVARVLEMVTIHDLVEVDAGDTFAYDPEHAKSKADREVAAADRLFGLLPPDDGRRLRALWEEFEEHQTPEACFANALDRFQALLLNFASGGGSWRTHGVRRSQVLARMQPVRTTLPGLWPYVLDVIDRSCSAGLITEG